MRKLGRNLAAAAMLLTRVPMPASAGTADPAGAAALYPVIGALTGASVGILVAGAVHLWPLLVVLVLVVAAELVLTGALHLDGLADCADSLGGHTREQRLQIMKDHSIGVYGAATIALHLLLKASLIGVLASVLSGVELVLVLAAAYAVSRGAMLPLAWRLPYAREDGTGRAVVEGLGRNHVAVGLTLSLVFLLPVAWVSAPVAAVAGAITLLTMALTAAVVTAALGLASRRRIGGVTGDVLGACAELTLSAMLLAGVAVLA